jgi:hypothetical protein
MKKLSSAMIFFFLGSQMAFSVGVYEQQLWNYVIKANEKPTYKEKVMYFCQSGSASVRASSGTLCDKSPDIALYILSVCGGLENDPRNSTKGVNSFVGSDCYNKAKPKLGTSGYPQLAMGLMYPIRNLLRQGNAVNATRTDTTLDGTVPYCYLLTQKDADSLKSVIKCEALLRTWP